MLHFNSLVTCPIERNIFKSDRISNVFLKGSDEEIAVFSTI